MPKPVVESWDDIIGLLEEPEELDALDTDMQELQEFEQDLQEFDEFMGKLQDAAAGPNEFAPNIQSEGDSLIGSDGGGLDNYIQNEQQATHMSMDQELQPDYIRNEQQATHMSMDQELDDDFLGSSDVESDYEELGGLDTDMTPIGTKRSWYNFNRYTKGKYREFQGEFTIGDDFADDLSDYDTDTESAPAGGEETAGGIRDFDPTPGGPRGNRVIEPQSVDYRPPGGDINSPVPEDNPLDEGGDPDDPFAVEPGDGPRLNPTEEPFSWSNPKTWVRRRPNTNDLGEPLLGTEMTDMSHRNMNLSERPSPVEASPEFTPEMRAGLNELIGKAKASGLSDAAIAGEMGIELGRGCGSAAPRSRTTW